MKTEKSASSAQLKRGIRSGDDNDCSAKEEKRTGGENKRDMVSGISRWSPAKEGRSGYSSLSRRRRESRFFVLPKSGLEGKRLLLEEEELGRRKKISLRGRKTVKQQKPRKGECDRLSISRPNISRNWPEPLIKKAKSGAKNS